MIPKKFARRPTNANKYLIISQHVFPNKPPSSLSLCPLSNPHCIKYFCIVCDKHFCSKEQTTTLECTQIKTIVVFGKTGSGKSSLLNAILGYHEFQTGDSKSEAVTRKSTSHKGVWRPIPGTPKLLITKKNKFSVDGDLEVRLVDTVGFLDPKLSEKEVLMRIGSFLEKLKPPVHAFLFVVSALESRFDQSLMDIAQTFSSLLGPSMFSNTAIVFTNSDRIAQENLKRWENDLPTIPLIKDHKLPFFFVDTQKKETLADLRTWVSNQKIWLDEVIYSNLRINGEQDQEEAQDPLLIRIKKVLEKILGKNIEDQNEVENYVKTLNSPLTLTMILSKIMTDDILTKKKNMVEYVLLTYRALVPKEHCEMPHNYLWKLLVLMYRKKIIEEMPVRVVNFIKQWIECCWYYDFNNNLDRKIEKFLTTKTKLASGSTVSGTTQCLSVLRKKRLRGHNTTNERNDTPFKFSLSTTAPNTIAEIIHEYDCQLWGNLLPWECLAKEKIKRIVTSGQLLDSWTLFQIQSSRNLRVCVTRVITLIDIITKLIELHNLNSSMSILFVVHNALLENKLLDLALPSSYRERFLKKLAPLTEFSGGGLLTKLTELEINLRKNSVLPIIPYIYLYSKCSENYKELDSLTKRDTTSELKISIHKMCQYGKLYQPIAYFRKFRQNVQVERKLDISDILGPVEYINNEKVLSDFREQIVCACIDDDLEIIKLILDNFSVDKRILEVVDKCVISNAPDSLELLLTHPNSKKQIDPKYINQGLEIAKELKFTNIISILLSCTENRNDLQFPEHCWVVPTSVNYKTLNCVRLRDEPFDIQDTLHIAKKLVQKNYLFKTNMRDDPYGIIQSESEQLQNEIKFFSMLFISIEKMHLFAMKIKQQEKDHLLEYYQIWGRLLWTYCPILKNIMENSNSSIVEFVQQLKNQIGTMKYWYNAYVEVTYAQDQTDINKIIQTYFPNILFRLIEMNISIEDAISLPLKRMQQYKKILESNQSHVRLRSDIFFLLKQVTRLCIKDETNAKKINTLKILQENLLLKLGVEDKKFFYASKRKFIASTEIILKNFKQSMCIILLSDHIVILSPGNKSILHKFKFGADLKITEESNTCSISITNETLTFEWQNSKDAKHWLDSALKAMKLKLEKELLHCASNSNETIFTACKNNDITTVQKLLQSGIQVNLSDPNGETPLHFAVYQRDLHLCKVLLLAGANPAHTNVAGQSPSYEAKRRKLTEITALFEQFYRSSVGSVFLTNPNDCDTPTILCKDGNLEKLKSWKQEEANGDTEICLNNLLYIASLYGHRLIVEWLCNDCGADPNFVQPEHGMTPLQVATIKDHFEISMILLNYGAIPIDENNMWPSLINKCDVFNPISSSRLQETTSPSPHVSARFKDNQNSKQSIKSDDNLTAINTADNKTQVEVEKDQLLKNSEPETTLPPNLSLSHEDPVTPRTKIRNARLSISSTRSQETKTITSNSFSPRGSPWINNNQTSKLFSEKSIKKIDDKLTTIDMADNKNVKKLDNSLKNSEPETTLPQNLSLSHDDPVTPRTKFRHAQLSISSTRSQGTKTIKTRPHNTTDDRTAMADNKKHV